MGKSHGSIKSRLNLCYSCNKPIVGTDFLVVNSTRTSAKQKYHSTPQECASADQLKRDWYRQNDKTKTHNRTKA